MVPLWLNSEFENFAPSGTGVLAMLEPAPTWQDSHPKVPMEMWPLGTVTIGFLMFALYRAALAVLWHWAQLVLVD